MNVLCLQDLKGYTVQQLLDNLKRPVSILIVQLLYLFCLLYYIIEAILFLLKQYCLQTQSLKKLGMVEQSDTLY